MFYTSGEGQNKDIIQVETDLEEMTEGGVRIHFRKISEVAMIRETEAEEEKVDLVEIAVVQEEETQEEDQILEAIESIEVVEIVLEGIVRDRHTVSNKFVFKFFVIIKYNGLKIQIWFVYTIRNMAIFCFYHW